ncbi:MAG: hypothetical protein WB817_17110 [Terriglobales bacterium]
MKRIRIATTVLCFLLFAAFANASPQQDEPKSKDASPAMQQPEEKPETKPEKQEQKPDEMKPEKNEKQDKDAKEQEKENKDQEKQEKKEDKNSGKEMGNMRNENQGNAHAAGGHIPDNKFRSSFGRSHTFHPSRPTVVNGRPTFAYGGYSFILVDPWPAGWAYTDDCYIDYIDGQYFLFDLAHPGVQIALMVSL